MSAFAEPTFALEPLTPRGVAAFARAPLGRLLLVQTVVAALATASILWLLYDGCFPTVTAAIEALPDTGEIRAGQLNWPDDSPVLLADKPFLAFVVDLDHGGDLRSPVDCQIEFGKNSVRAFSLFGEAEIFYPAGQYPFNSTDLKPLWGAWSPDLLALAGLAAFFGLLLTWAALATVYFLPVWLLGFFTNRDLDFRQSWRLAGAALMPGSLLLALAILLYDFCLFDLVQLSFAFGMHFVIGWIYLFISLLFLKRTAPADKANPFAAK